MIALSSLVVACTGERERVILPPEAPMNDINKIAVVGFDNFTTDPGAATLIESFIQQQLHDSRVYDTIDTSLAKAALFDLDIDKAQLVNPDTARHFGNHLGVDAIITGEVSYYFENISMGTPTCYACNAQTKTGTWSVWQTTEVIFEIRARVVRTSTGAIIWSKTEQKRETVGRSHTVPHDTDAMPPYNVIPQWDRRDVPTTRQRAASAVTAAFTDDLLPRAVWVRIDR